MTAVSGQKTVPSAGTAVPLGDLVINAPLALKALDTNTGIVAVGNDGAGDVSLSNGFRLAAGEMVVFEFVSSLASLLLDSAVNGEGVSFLVLSV